MIDIEYLKRLREVTNQICGEALKQQKDIPGGEGWNWDHIYCREAGHCIDKYNYEYDIIFVEGTGPSAIGLKNFIHDRLLEMGFTDVEVYLGWE